MPGRTYKRMGKLGDAIAVLDDALKREAKEVQKHRIPVVYWNRACYLTLASQDVGKDVARILEDLAKAIAQQPSFAVDLMAEPDLTKLHGNASFQAFVEKNSGKKEPPMISDRTTA